MNTETRIGVLVKTSLVDFPGRVAAALFLGGCNLRCPYCYNTELVTGNALPEDAVSASQVLAHLEKRKNVLTGFVISGGEPLLSPVTEYLITQARALGYKIKLDTNGTLPERLSHLLQSPALCPDFVALDVKTSPEKYGLCTSGGNAANAANAVNAVNAANAVNVANAANAVNAVNATNAVNVANATEKIEESVRLVSALPADRREFRTVLVPPLITEADVERIARMLPADAAWKFAAFKPGGCIDPSYDEISPFLDSETAALIAKARTIIPGAELR